MAFTRTQHNAPAVARILAGAGRATIVALVILLSAPGFAEPPPLVDTLRQGGLVILIRHGVTEPGIGDPPEFRLDDCATQRNLSEAGRTQARSLGEWFRDQDIPVGAVRSSQWCRCLDTARLAFGAHHPIDPWPALNSFFDRRADAPIATRSALDSLASAFTGNQVWVTHQVNISALTGTFAAMGELIVTRPVRRDRQWQLEPVGRFKPDG